MGLEDLRKLMSCKHLTLDSVAEAVWRSSSEKGDEGRRVMKGEGNGSGVGAGCSRPTVSVSEPVSWVVFTFSMATEELIPAFSSLWMHGVSTLPTICPWMAVPSTVPKTSTVIPAQRSHTRHYSTASIGAQAHRGRERASKSAPLEARGPSWIKLCPVPGQPEAEDLHTVVLLSCGSVHSSESFLNTAPMLLGGRSPQWGD